MNPVFRCPTRRIESDLFFSGCATLATEKPAAHWQRQQLELRSIFVHLVNAEKSDVSEVLDDSYKRNNDEPQQWLCLEDNEAVLYIEYYSDYHEYESVEWSRLDERLGAKPSITVVADVSGRYSGRSKAVELVQILLSNFEGIAQDDSEGAWSLNEIVEDRTYEGNVFFPY